MPKRPRKDAKTRQAPLATVPEKPSYVAEMEKILFEAQHDCKLFNKYCIQLKDIFEKISTAEFCKEIRRYLRFILPIEESANMRTALDFLAFFTSFINSNAEAAQSQNETSEPEMHPLFKFVIDTTIELTTCDNVIIRSNAILFLTKVLASMGEDATIDDDLFGNIIECLIERLQDVGSKVRQYAVEACKRLQQPGDENDPVIRTYLFHIKHDPSRKVKQSVLKCIHNRFLYNADIVDTVTDPNEKVRFEAFLRYEKVKLERLKISDRQKILRRGLVDPDKRIYKFVSTQLVWSWIKYCNNSVTKLLNLIRLDTTPQQKDNYNRVVKKLVQVILEKESEVIGKILPINPDTKVLNVVDMSGYMQEAMLLWKHVVSHFYSLKKADEVLPQIKEFVDLFKSFRENRMDHTHPGEESIIKNEYESTCLYFYEMMMFFEVEDEGGREYLVATLLNILKNERPSSDHIKIIVKVLRKFMIKFDDWHDHLIEIINDIYEPIIVNEMPPPPPPDLVQRRREDDLLTESMHELELKRSDGRLKCFALEEEKHIAISNKDYKRAEEIDNEIAELTKTLKQLETPRRKTIMPPAETVVNEVREITKDIEEHKYALQILHGTLTYMEENTPSIHMLRETMLLPYFRTEEPNLLRLIINCIGSMSLADMSIASQYFVWIYSKVLDPRQIIWESALKMIIDIYRRFGMEDFNYTPERPNNVTLKRKLCTEDAENMDSIVGNQTAPESAFTFIDIMSLFLQSSDPSKRALAVSGLVKLYLHKQISSKKMLARLLILWFHPESGLEENNRMSQQIGLLFAELSAGRSLGQEALIEILVPILNMLLNAPVDSSLTTISVDDVIKVIIDLSTPSESSTLNVHNTLGLHMCSQLKKISKVPSATVGNNGNFIQAYTKILALCAPTIDDEEIKIAAINCCTDIIKDMTDKTTIKNIARTVAVLKGNATQTSDGTQTENGTTKMTPARSFSDAQNTDDETMETAEHDNSYESDVLFSDDE